MTQPESTKMEAVSGPICLKDAIRISLFNNPDIDASISRIRQSEALIAEANSTFWPVISAFGEYMQGNAPSAYLFKSIDQRSLPAGVDFNDPGWFENYEVGLHGRLNLYNGGRDLLRRRIAETGLSISELDRSSVENALIASVIEGFFNVLAARDFILTAEISVKTVETELKIMQIRYEGGGALKSDVLSLNVRLAQAREDLVRAQNNYSLSIAALVNLLGVQSSSDIVCVKGEEFGIAYPPDYESGLMEAMANRPELQKIRQQIIRSRLALDIARSEYLPRLDAQSRIYWDDPDLDFSEDRKNWTAGILLNWDIFSGLSTKAKLKKENAALEEMMAADRKTVLSIQLDLKISYLKLAEAEARLNVTEASVAQAEESLRLVRKQYEGGSASITRYLDAELARNKSRIRATAAFYDREMARSAVGRALGYWAGYAKGIRDNDE